MKTNAYSIYDRKTLTYHLPFFQTTDGAAVRAFVDLCNDKDTGPGRHPVDYVLFRIGTYDDQLGLMVAETPLVHIKDGSAAVAAPIVDLFSDANPEKAA